jgi:hypothetical protein
MKIRNPYTSQTNQELFKKKFMEKKKLKKEPSGGAFLQTITFRCSFNHVKSSLAKLCESFQIPINLHKTGLDHNAITADNYMELRPQWEPYLKLDVISLACCIAKYNSIMKTLVGQNMQSCISSPQLTLKGWTGSLPKDECVKTHRDKYIRHFIRQTVKGGRVFATIKNFESPLWSKIKEILMRFADLNGFRDDNSSSSFAMTSSNAVIPTLMQWYNKTDTSIKNQIRDEINALEQNDEDFMIPFDATSLYPSAMWDENSEFPDITSGRTFRCSEEKEVLNLFNSQKFRPKTGFFKIKYYYPPEQFLQHLPVKEKICIRGSKKYEVSRFRNGYITDYLNSVDIQEIVRTGGRIERIFEGVIYEKNLKASPFRGYIEKLFALRKKYKDEGNKVGEDLIKLLLNSLYGKTVQKDVNTEICVWSSNYLEKNYDDLIMSRCKISEASATGEAMWIVQRKKEKENVDVSKQDSKNGIITSSKKENKCRDVPHHLGSYILSHSRRIMNNFILAIDGFKKPNIAYSDTDSIYIKKSLYDELNRLGHVGGDLCKGKNDYNSGGIVYGLYLAPKIKYNLVLDNGILSEKKTFKGLNRVCLKSNDFFTLAAGQIVKANVPQPWKRDFKKGVRIPDPENDIDKKEFNPEINILKRREPDIDGIMRPYYISNPGAVVELTDDSITIDDCDVDEIESSCDDSEAIDIEREREQNDNTDDEDDDLLPSDDDDDDEDIHIFTKCYKCKEVKSILDYYESHQGWCKTCINESHIRWLKNTPNAQKAEWLRNKIRNREYLEQFTELRLEKFNEWMEFTKGFYIPKDYKGQIDIEHLYPLSKYDLSKEENVKHCLNWKHLRYMTHDENIKKANKLPTEEEIKKQEEIVEMFMGRCL